MPFPNLMNFRENELNNLKNQNNPFFTFLGYKIQSYGKTFIPPK